METFENRPIPENCSYISYYLGSIATAQRVIDSTTQQGMTGLDILEVANERAQDMTDAEERLANNPDLADSSDLVLSAFRQLSSAYARQHDGNLRIIKNMELLIERETDTIHKHLDVHDKYGACEAPPYEPPINAILRFLGFRSKPKSTGE